LRPPVFESCQLVCCGTLSVVSRTLDNRSAMLSQRARKSACQFVYHRTLGAICRTQNNRGSILSPPAQEPVIQKVAKYGMKDPCMLYKISCPYFIKVHVFYVLLVSLKISRCGSWQMHMFRFPLTFISLAQPNCTNFLV
jgi:hypothetical protein